MRTIAPFRESFTWPSIKQVAPTLARRLSTIFNRRLTQSKAQEHSGCQNFDRQYSSTFTSADVHKALDQHCNNVRDSEDPFHPPELPNISPVDPLCGIIRPRESQKTLETQKSVEKEPLRPLSYQVIPGRTKIEPDEGVGRRSCSHDQTSSSHITCGYAQPKHFVSLPIGDEVLTSKDERPEALAIARDIRLRLSLASHEMIRFREQRKKVGIYHEEISCIVAQLLQIVESALPCTQTFDVEHFRSLTQDLRSSFEMVADSLARLDDTENRVVESDRQAKEVIITFLSRLSQRNVEDYDSLDDWPFETWTDDEPFEIVNVQETETRTPENVERRSPVRETSHAYRSDDTEKDITTNFDLALDSHLSHYVPPRHYQDCMITQEVTAQHSELVRYSGSQFSGSRCDGDEFNVYLTSENLEIRRSDLEPLFANTQLRSLSHILTSSDYASLGSRQNVLKWMWLGFLGSWLAFSRFVHHTAWNSPISKQLPLVEHTQAQQMVRLTWYSDQSSISRSGNHRVESSRKSHATNLTSEIVQERDETGKYESQSELHWSSACVI